MTHKGGCHCGKIAYEFEGEIGAVFEQSQNLLVDSVDFAPDFIERHGAAAGAVSAGTSVPFGAGCATGRFIRRV